MKEEEKNKELFRKITRDFLRVLAELGYFPESVMVDFDVDFDINLEYLCSVQFFNKE